MPRITVDEGEGISTGRHQQLEVGEDVGQLQVFLPERARLAEILMDGSCVVDEQIEAARLALDTLEQRLHLRVVAVVALGTLAQADRHEFIYFQF